MGMYDTYGKHGEQLKVGPCLLREYRLGDTVEIVDGVYFGYDRAIIINHGVFIADIDIAHVYTKWGVRIRIDVSATSPVKLALDEIEKAHEIKEKSHENSIDGRDEDASPPPTAA